MPSPLSMTFLMMIKNHLDGTIFESNFRGKGIFSIGNMNPVNNNVGNNIPVNEIFNPY